jgi:hypothetical protein
MAPKPSFKTGPEKPDWPDFQLPFAAFPPEPRSNPGQNAAMHIIFIALHKIDMIGVFTLGCLMKGIPVTRSA